MPINYVPCTPTHIPAALDLQHEWADESITFGVVPDTFEYMSAYDAHYFYIALDGERAVGYITAEAVRGSEYNIFPPGADYLRVNDLYVRREYRGMGVGRQLLKLAEDKAGENGISCILISSATKDAEAVRRFYTGCGYGIWTTEFYKRTKAAPDVRDGGAPGHKGGIVPVAADNRGAVTDFIVREWYSTDMLIRGEVVDMTKVDGFALFEHSEIIGLITYLIRDGICEITSLDSKRENRGTGTALLERVIAEARTAGCRRIQLVTTNDNINAIRFYQKRGFDLVGVNLGAIDRERERKPQIPHTGNFGIPLRHELDFAMELESGH